MAPPLIRKLRFILLTIISLYAIRYTLYASDVPNSKYVRVAIMQDVASLRLKVKGFYEVTEPKTGRVLCLGKNLNVTVMAYKGGVLLGNIRPGVSRLIIKPNEPDAVVINGRVFRGNIELIKKENTHLLVINDIELEDYIKGISVREISHYWPPEALTAEVIVFRTFALYKIKESAGKDYDLTSDIYSQVYGGKAAERYRINKAVDDTKGVVLTYKGKIFPAFYHATCAGHTEDASRLWNVNMAPLKGVVCRFCKDSPHFRWHYVATCDEVRDKLDGRGHKIDNIKDIIISGRDASGRVTDLRIVSSKREIKISAKDFRDIIGPNIIKSTNFKLNLVGSDIVFEGFGWGHGAGLCQWGAYFMAKGGYKFEDILEYYYPGTKISSLPLNP